MKVGAKFCAVLCMFWGVVVDYAQGAGENELFNYVSNSNRVTQKLAVTQTAGMHNININHQIATIDVGSSVALPLPDGTSIAISITRKVSMPNGDTQLTGQFSREGIAIVTYGKDSTFANIASPDHNYAIGVDADKTQFLVDYKASEFEVDLNNDMLIPDGFEPMSHTRRASKVQAASRSTMNASGKSEIALLAIYSSEFASGFANPVTRINQMIAFTNAAYERSGVDIELQLAHAEQIAFNNGSTPRTLLGEVTDATGSFTGVPALRDQYSADLIAVLPFKSSGGVAGVAWVNGDSPDSAYSVTQFAVWGSDAVFAHEIGHNLGSGHERISANSGQSQPCSGGYTGYSCGHGNGSQGTIMSYLDDVAWGYVFSNPQMDCNGEPCGIANGQANPADNKTSFNITGPLVANFRVGSGVVESQDELCFPIKTSDTGISMICL